MIARKLSAIGRRAIAYGVVAVGVVLSASGSAQAVTVHTSDFIADGTRTGFNGFEAIPNDGIHFTGGPGPYVEGGIRVEQVGGDPGNDIWVKFFFPEGEFGWYPDGGDNGYTKLTMSDGSDFNDIGFLHGTGFFGGSTLFYELYNNGSLVLSGSVGDPFGGDPNPPYLGFSGGGFDEIRLSNNFGGLNAAAIDAIEVRAASVPEPASMALLGMGFAGLAGYRLRRRRTA